MPRRTVRAPEPRGRMPAPELPEQQAWAHRAWRPAWVLHDRAWDRPAQRRLREPPRVRSPQPGKPEPQEPQGPLPREPASQRPTWARRRALGRRRAWVHPDGDRQQAWALLRQQPRRRARPRKSHGPGERPGPRWWNWRSGRIRPSPSGDSAVSCSRLRALLRARRPGPWPRFSSICRPGESPRTCVSAGRCSLLSTHRLLISVKPAFGSLASRRELGCSRSFGRPASTVLRARPRTSRCRRRPARGPPRCRDAERARRSVVASPAPDTGAWDESTRHGQADE